MALRFIIVSLLVHLAIIYAFVTLAKYEKPAQPTSYMLDLVTPPPTALATPDDLTATDDPVTPEDNKQSEPSSDLKPPGLDNELPSAVPSALATPDDLATPADIKKQATPVDETPAQLELKPLAINNELPSAAAVRLFDRDVIGKISQVPKDVGSRNKRDDSITIDTDEYIYRGYMQRVKEAVEGAWEYPNEAMRKNIYGDLLIRFVIRVDGSLGSVEVIRTSGQPMLDNNAVEALRNAAPFWPIPKNWGTKSMIVTGHFYYTLYGTFIR